MVERRATYMIEKGRVCYRQPNVTYRGLRLEEGGSVDWLIKRRYDESGVRPRGASQLDDIDKIMCAREC